MRGSSKISSTPLEWHVHFLRLIQRSILDDSGDLDAVERKIGFLYQRVGLGLIRKTTGSAPLSMQAATPEQMRAALALVVGMIASTMHHPYEHFPNKWRESLEWAKSQT